MMVSCVINEHEGLMKGKVMELMFYVFYLIKQRFEDGGGKGK